MTLPSFLFDSLSPFLPPPIPAGDFITRLYASVESCEVDPRKCPAADLPINQRHLKESCEEVVQKITEMHG